MRTDIADWYSYARNCDLPFVDYVERFVEDGDTEVRARLARIVTAYEARKAQRGYLDFDDILVRFADRLADDAHLRAEVASRYEDILVDEFQDTNPVQWRILEALSTTTHGSRADLSGPDFARRRRYGADARGGRDSGDARPPSRRHR